MKYSVLYDPVISVQYMDGTVKEQGIYDILVHAHEIRDIQADSPLEKVALLRLLVVFTMEIFHPTDLDEHLFLLEQNSLNKHAIDHYIADCESEGPCFDLFDNKNPFMQHVFDPDSDVEKIKSVVNLSLTLPSGNNNMFWEHRPENVNSMSISEAFRSMLSLFLFCYSMAARDYSLGVNGKAPVYHFVYGNNLFQTLLLNSCSQLSCNP